MINWDRTLYLVEGGFDLLSLIPLNVAPLLGKDLSTALFAKIKEHKPHVVIVLDPDAKKNSVRILQKLNNIYSGEEHKLRIVELSGSDDVDEIRKKFGQKKLIEYFYRARRLNNNDYFLFDKYNARGRRVKPEFSKW